MRDAQRQKVYDAEWAWERTQQSEAVDLAEAQDWLDVLAAEFDTPAVTIKRNARIRQWGGWYKSYEHLIEVPRGSVTLKTVLHEFAHHLEFVRYRRTTNYRDRIYTDPGHGGAFTECHLDVLEAVYGAESRAGLEAAYKAKGVTIGAQAAADKEQSKAAAAERRRARNLARQGEEGDVYAIRLTTARWGTMYLDEGRYLARSIWGAQVWRTEAAARKAAARRTRKGDTVELVKARARFQCSWQGERGHWSTQSDAQEETVDAWVKE